MLHLHINTKVKCVSNWYVAVCGSVLQRVAVCYSASLLRRSRYEHSNEIHSVDVKESSKRIFFVEQSSERIFFVEESSTPFFDQH